MHGILFPFGLIILAGVAFRRMRPSGVEAGAMSQAINAGVLNLFLPALCIKTMYQSTIDHHALLVPATACVTTLTALLLAAGTYSLLSKKLQLAPQEKGVVLLAAAFGNVTYLGLPVITGLFGQSAAQYALYYDLLATTPLLWLVGATMAARCGGDREYDIPSALKTIVSLPPVWGIFAGMALNLTRATLPPFMVSALDMLGGLVVPLMIFSIGLALTFPKVAHAFAVLPAVVIKLALSPFISFLAAKTLGLSGTALTSTVLEGAMPSMVLTLLVAGRYNLDISLGAFMIVVTTTLSFFTLPAILYLVGV
ncbi:MAG TPA: AEC family transporter [Thermodesulfovibrionales bacterium]|nr:AEC family transporter [Thermodesulfovibrionales bacterium]